MRQQWSVYVRSNRNVPITCSSPKMIIERVLDHVPIFTWTCFNMFNVHLKNFKMQSLRSEKWKFTITNHLKTLTTAIRYEKLKQNMEFFENQIFLISQQFSQIKIQQFFIQSIWCINNINSTKDFGKILNF